MGFIGSELGRNEPAGGQFARLCFQEYVTTYTKTRDE